MVAHARRVLRHAAVSPCPRCSTCSIRPTPSPASSRSPIGRAAAARRSPTRPSRRWPSSTGIPVFQPDASRPPRLRTTLRAWRPDLGVVAAYGRIIPGASADDSAPRHDQRARVAAAEVSRRRARASRGHRRRYAKPASRSCAWSRSSTPARCSPRRRGRSARTRRATSSKTRLAELGARLLVDVVDQIAAGPRAKSRRTTRARPTRRRLTKEEGLIDWSLPALGHSQPRARTLSMAARVHVSERRRG